MHSECLFSGLILNDWDVQGIHHTLQGAPPKAALHIFNAEPQPP